MLFEKPHARLVHDTRTATNPDQMPCRVNGNRFTSRAIRGEPSDMVHRSDRIHFVVDEECRSLHRAVGANDILAGEHHEVILKTRTADTLSHGSEGFLAEGV